MTSRRAFIKSSALAMFGMGAAPAWLARSVYAADGPGRRKEILFAHSPRGAGAGPHPAGRPGARLPGLQRGPIRSAALGRVPGAHRAKDSGFALHDELARACEPGVDTHADRTVAFGG